MTSTYPTTLEFEKHSANAAAVKRELKQLERAHKAAIRNGDGPQIHMLRRVHSLYGGVLAEAMLRKIVTDPNGFTDLERASIWRVVSQVDRWLHCIELAFRRHHKILLHLEVSSNTLATTDFNQFVTVQALIDRNLRPVIEDRNKLAHGQWVYHLKSRQENVFKTEEAPEPPNYIVTRAQTSLIEHIARLVYVLAVSHPTFGRDYEEVMQKIEDSKAQLDGDSYEQFVTRIRATRRSS